ncbi:amino acid permease [Mycolicibacterium goodii]|uniref:amino acid permease n=1 Tax=Mycolicibacterium goodii TaxID=134601 RepID=UPI0035563780
MKSPSDRSAQPEATLDSSLRAEQAGYQKQLKARQVQMIAIGGAIGTGLFLGAGGRLAAAGPALTLVYAACGLVAYLMLRALGELVVYRPTSGSFVSYAREFYGEKVAFFTGWIYWMSWATTAVVDVTAIALYMKFFGRYSSAIAHVPQWVFALGALLIVLTLNLFSVKVFGEMEFWLALIKVAALTCFLAVAIYLLIFGKPIDGVHGGFTLIQDHGGLIPNGILPAVVMVQGVMFAYASIELIGTAAGETANVEVVIPRAVRTVMVRIAVFYVGSILLLSMTLPYPAFRADESPFVTFFSHLDVPGVDAIMNLIVLSAALSSLNAGLYSTGRVLRSMAEMGSAPQFTRRMSRRGVPYGGIALTAVVALIGVGLNAWVPEDAFEIVINLSAFGTITAWGMIALCHNRLTSLARRKLLMRPAFQMKAAPYSNYVVLLFLASVVVLMAFDFPIGTWTIVALIVILIPALYGGWLLRRKREG